MQDAGDAEAVYYLNNHLRFTVMFNANPETELSRIVAFEVEPFSVKHAYEGALDKAAPRLVTCAPESFVQVKHDMEPQAIREGEEVIFTYDVLFQARAHAPCALRLRAAGARATAGSQRHGINAALAAIRRWCVHELRCGRRHAIGARCACRSRR